MSEEDAEDADEKRFVSEAETAGMDVRFYGTTERAMAEGRARVLGGVVAGWGGALALGLLP